MLCTLYQLTAHSSFSMGRSRSRSLTSPKLRLVSNFNKLVVRGGVAAAEQLEMLIARQISLNKFACSAPAQVQNFSPQKWENLF